MILTIDIGTSNFKTAVYDYDGNRLGFASCPLLINGDCSQWIEAYKNCRKQLGAFKEIEAIVISGNGPTLVPVLEDESTGVARLWLDHQKPEGSCLNRTEKYQDEVTAVMGGFVDARFFLPKILKIKNEENELYNRTKHFLGCPEYLAYYLTQEARTVFPSDGFNRWFWNTDALNKLELDKAKFPPFIRPGDKFGFMGNIPVISGGPDFFAAILGAGITQPGQALDRTGSSEGINLCTEKQHNEPKLMSYSHPIKPFWNLSCIISKTGIKIEQESKILGFANIEDFLASDKSKPHLEELCFAVKDIITMMEKTCEKVNELRVTGGMAANEYFNQMKANITGKKIIELECKEAELLGCAIIGSCALGKYSSYIEACEKMVKIKKEYSGGK